MTKQKWILLALIITSTLVLMYTGFTFESTNYSYNKVTNYIIQFSWLTGVFVLAFYLYGLKNNLK